jgi:hypothetical protein
MTTALPPPLVVLVDFVSGVDCDMLLLNLDPSRRQSDDDDDDIDDIKNIRKVYAI